MFCCKPDEIECRVVGRPEINKLQPGLVCDLKTGLLCNAKDKSSKFTECLDYEFRVKCCKTDRSCEKPKNAKIPNNIQTSTQTPLPSSISNTETYSIVDYQDPFASQPTLHSAQFLIITGSMMVLVLICIITVFLKFRSSRASQDISKNNNVRAEENKQKALHNDKVVMSKRNKSNSNNNNNSGKNLNIRWNDQQDVYLNSSRFYQTNQFINNKQLQGHFQQFHQSNVPQTKVTVTRCLSNPTGTHHHGGVHQLTASSTTHYESSMKTITSTSSPTIGTTSPARYRKLTLIIYFDELRPIIFLAVICVIEII